MWHQHFDHHHLLGLSILAMLLFAAAFVGVVARALAQGEDSPRSAHLARLPFIDGDGDRGAPQAASQESEP